MRPVSDLTYVELMEELDETAILVSESLRCAMPNKKARSRFSEKPPDLNDYTVALMIMAERHNATTAELGSRITAGPKRIDSTYALAYARKRAYYEKLFENFFADPEASLEVLIRRWREIFREEYGKLSAASTERS